MRTTTLPTCRDDTRARPTRFDRWSRRAILAATIATGAALAIPAAVAQDGRDSKWVASWATSPAAFFVYTAPVAQNQALGRSPTTFAAANIQPDLAFPFPDANTTGATANNQTIRSIVKPDLWGNTMRFRFPTSSAISR